MPFTFVEQIGSHRLAQGHSRATLILTPSQINSNFSSVGGGLCRRQSEIICRLVAWRRGSVRLPKGSCKSGCITMKLKITVLHMEKKNIFTCDPALQPSTPSSPTIIGDCLHKENKSHIVPEYSGGVTAIICPTFPLYHSPGINDNRLYFIIGTLLFSFNTPRVILPRVIELIIHLPGHKAD